MQPVSPKNEKHVDDHLNISSVLAFSDQQEALIAAQQQVTQRVMDNNHMLREALKAEHARAEHLQQLLEAERAKNKALEARVAQLESRPLNVNGPYIESANIERYLNLPVTPKRPRRIKPTITTNDPTLPLWDSNLA